MLIQSNLFETSTEATHFSCSKVRSPVKIFHNNSHYKNNSSSYEKKKIKSYILRNQTFFITLFNEDTTIAPISFSSVQLQKTSSLYSRLNFL